MFERVCEFMEVDHERIRLSIVADETGAMRQHLPFWEGSSHGAAGLFTGDNRRATIKVSAKQLGDPTALVATFAHELGHVLLLCDQKLSPEAEDGEHLTDLLTVVLGLGIFNANSAVTFGQWSSGGQQGWSASRLGYLSPQMWGYALVYFAHLRGEAKPDWAQFLEGDVRHYFKAGMRYLAKDGAA